MIDFRIAKIKKTGSPFRQPGYLDKTRGFPPPPLSRFAFSKIILQKLLKLK